MRQLLQSFGCACLLSGCGSMLESKEPAERVYWLEAAPVAAAPQTSEVAVSLVPGLDSRRIWILQKDGRLNYFAGAVWQDNLGRLLQSVIERSLQAEGAPGQRMDVLVERFFALEPDAERAPVVVLRARLSGRSWTCVFETEATAASDRLRDIVRAHKRVLDELTGEVDRLAPAGARDAPDC